MVLVKDEGMLKRELRVVEDVFNEKGLEYNQEYLVNYHNNSEDFNVLMSDLLTELGEIDNKETKAFMNLFTVSYYQYAMIIKDFKEDIVLNEDRDLGFKKFMEENSESDLWKAINYQDRVNLMFVSIALPEYDVALEVGILLLLKQVARLQGECQDDEV